MEAGTVPPRVLGIVPGFVPSTIMDVAIPLLALDRAGKIAFRIGLESFIRQAELKWADAIVFSRTVEPEHGDAVNFALQRGIPVIYDIDDNFFDIPADTELGRYYQAPERQKQLGKYISTAALVRVYSRLMLSRALSINPACVLVQAPINWRLIEPKPEQREGDPIHIVYATSREEDPLVKIILPAIQEILSRYPGRVEMYFLGNLPESMAGKPGVHHWPLMYDYSRFMKRFSRHGFSIGLAPMLENTFYQSKTNNKYREYAACQIAGIYSDVSLYQDCVHHEKTGLLVRNDTGEWVNALARLIQDTALRGWIQQEAYKQVRQSNTPGSFEQVWFEQIQQVLARSDLPSIELNPTVRIETHPGGEDRGANTFGRTLWRKIVRRAKRLGRGEASQTMQSLYRHAACFWYVYKINVLKSL